MATPESPTFPYCLTPFTNHASPLSIIRTISVPLPTHRLALSALRALRVDAELSPLVSRTFSLTRPATSTTSISSPSSTSPPPPLTPPSALAAALAQNNNHGLGLDGSTSEAHRVERNGVGGVEERNGALRDGDGEGEQDVGEEKTVLRTEYRATTNRMLRVAVNGFMESLGVVLGVMEELDVDVLEGEGQGG
ncbi:hypothetical protein MMC16_004679 [Acarospora aff. strigata]|nr:hypothetical protein [Acarospora aff. strigata]